MLKTTAIVTIVAFASSDAACAAGPFKDNERQEYKTERVSADMAIGVMSGKANEFVFDSNGALISKLIWKYDNNAVLSGGVAVTPFQNFTIGLRGRTSLTGASTMDDFDFPGAICGVTGPLCQSHHENTTLKTATSVDVGAAYALYNRAQFKLSGVAGYRWDHSAWDASGGTSNYAPPFPNVSVIAYDQWWEAPYLGVEVAGRWERLSLQARAIGSLLAHSDDRDDHKLRTLLFSDDFRRSDMVSTNVKVAYEVFQRASVTIAWDYDRWFTAKGSTVMQNYATGSTQLFPGDAAGASSETHTISLGLQYKY
jgi:outer membrane protease